VLAANWNIHQSNGFDVTLNIQKGGNRLTGTAFYVLGGSRFVNGVVEGRSFNVADLDFTVSWDNGAVGHYAGIIGSDGFVKNGTTDDMKDRSSRANWVSTTAVRQLLWRVHEIGSSGRRTNQLAGPGNEGPIEGRFSFDLRCRTRRARTEVTRGSQSRGAVPQGWRRVS